MEAERTRQAIAEMSVALREEFLSAIAQSDWRLLKKTDRVKPQEFAHLIVLGIAFWSRPDLLALNMLAKRLGSKNTTVFVGDIDEFGFTDGFKAFVPDAAMPNKTPVAAEYSGGMLIWYAEGQDAFKWIKESL